jgi:ketosteroid isomerase-like protein
MTPEEMKAALVRMNDDAWHKRDLEAAYRIYADDIVFQRIPFPPVVGKEANKQADAGTLAAFSDVRSTIDDMFVDGETAVIRWTWEGTHSGTSTSLGHRPPTRVPMPKARTLSSS